jgi:hypothetical protein
VYMSENVTTYKTVDAWLSYMGVDFTIAVGEIGISRHHAMFVLHVFLKHRDLSLLASSRTTLYQFQEYFP